jgi:glycosyltransferase involved in cell wall biosynthesis
MNEEILLKEYRDLCENVQKIYVVPLINFSFKKTSYLYLLYKNFIEEKEKYNLDIESLSIFALPKIVLSRFINRKSLLHYHWLEISDLQSLSGMIWKLFWITVFKLINGKIIWTIHNTMPHSSNYILLNRAVRKYMAHLADRLQVHCKSAVNIMSPLLNVGKDNFFIIEHPVFPVENMEKNKAVYFLNKKFFHGKILSNDKLFLMFGEIAAYKGIKEVIEIFNYLEQDKKLIIAGTVKKGNEKYYSEMLSLIKNDKQILIESKRINDEDVPVFFNSIDFVLFNFRDVLTSGSVVLALNYKKDVIIPQMGCLNEIVGKNVIKFKTQEELKNILTKIN